MEVNLASQTHHIPHVGLPHKEPVTIEEPLEHDGSPDGVALVVMYATESQTSNTITDKRWYSQIESGAEIIEDR